MSMDLKQAEQASRTIGGEHRQAIIDSEATARNLARAEADYHRALAVQTAMAKQEFGSATMAETMAKGSSEVREAKEARDILAAQDRAAMERIRLARDDRQALISIMSWSRAREQAE